jgi:hypothetical protein
MNGFHDESRMARETDARERGEIRREQDARWGDPHVCACGEPKSRTAVECAECSSFGRFLEDDQ